MYHEAYLCYGIALRPSLHFKAANTPEAGSLFISVGSDTPNEYRLIEQSATAHGMEWVPVPDLNLTAKFRPLSEVLSAPEKFSSLMIDWIDGETPLQSS